ncbi:hypothetical protein BH10PSE7_BH10PSE7_15410 [soil metagenome]
MRELHNNIKAIRAISPVAVGTTGTGQAGKIIDRQGYRGIEFIIGYGSITATNATFTPVMKEGDATGTMTSVADGNLLGTEAAAGIAGAATRTSGVSKNVTKRLGYRGYKRYVQIGIKSTVTAAVPVHADAILFGPHTAPVAT